MADSFMWFEQCLLNYGEVIHIYLYWVFLSPSLSLYTYIYIYTHTHTYLERKQVIISIHNRKSHVPHFYVSPRSYRRCKDWIWNEFGNDYQGVFGQTHFFFLSELISCSQAIFPLSHRTHRLVCHKKTIWCLWNLCNTSQCNSIRSVFMDSV